MIIDLIYSFRAVDLMEAWANVSAAAFTPADYIL